MKVRTTKAKISFGTKAETLERLRGRMKTAVVDDLIKFSVTDWKKNPDRIVRDITKRFRGRRLIVRSSARAEDLYRTSNAGHFTSVGDVRPDPKLLEKAIRKVIASYDGGPKDQVFVQEYISGVEMSGVIFTRDINSLAPYMTINYDDESGRTDLITSGQGNGHKTLVIFRGRKPVKISKQLIRVCKAVDELEALFGNDALDIEFSVKAGRVHILQVRPIAASGKAIPGTDEIAAILDAICESIEEFGLPHPDLYGDKTMYGIMPDWNPAEMIGVKPRPLALSLYRELITDSIWAFQRDNYGYKRLRSFPLILAFAGHPYVDIRVDFNSFIPKKLDDALSHKLTNFYYEKLKSSPASHDKVEFDIVFSCYTLDLKKRLAELADKGFSGAEIDAIESALLELTDNIIGKKGLCRDDLDKIDILEDRFRTLVSSDLTDIKKIYWLVEDCKRYGTLPFAGIARAAFIAMQLLDSMVSLGIFTLEEKSRFLNSMNTITRQLSDDARRVTEGSLTAGEFIAKYGHLRPGTYDILSDNYADSFEDYFDHKTKPADRKAAGVKAFQPSAQQLKKIDRMLKEHRLSTDAAGLLEFMRMAITGREYAKFAFTRNVNEILRLIKRFGKSLGLSTDDMSFTEIGTFIRMHSSVAAPDKRKFLLDEIGRNRSIHGLYRYLRLPHLITEPEDIYCFHLSKIEPNFVTTGRVQGETAMVKAGDKRAKIDGKVVMIENADPGFDWIFSHNIKGLVTCYGGANSHMAIRAAELNIPAVIGCGSALFEEWSRARRLEIDCLNRKVLIPNPTARV